MKVLLTPAELRLRDAVSAFIDSSGKSPTQKEMSTIVGTTQPGIARLVAKCVAKGALVKEPFKWRGLSIPLGPDAVLCDRCKALMGSAANDDVEVDAGEVSA